MESKIENLKSKIERKRHYAVEKLSPAGKTIVDQGLAENLTYQKIIDAVKAATGEKVQLSSLQRYHARKWFPTRQLLEQTERLYAPVKEALEKSNGKKLDEVSSELLKTHLFNAMAAIKDPDPLKLYGLVISEGWLDVEKEKLGIHKERTGLMRDRVKVLEGQLKLAQEKWNGTRERTDKAVSEIEKIGKKKGLDAETLKRIREEVYGIVDAAGS